MAEGHGHDFTRVESEAWEWVMSFASGTARPDDLAALRQWSARSPAHREAFDRISRTWRGLGAVGATMPVVPAAAAPRPMPGRRLLVGGALAVAAAGVAAAVVRPPLGLWPSFTELTADYRTEPGQKRRIALGDDVAIELNTRTSVSLRPGAGRPGGTIELITGEAVISAMSPVAGPVTVVAAGGRVMATSARFNLRRDDAGRVGVACLEGSVEISCGGATLSLTAGQQVVYSGDGMGRTTGVDAAMVTAWQQGLVIFRSTPVTEVVAEVNRYRPGRVILTNAALGQRELNARFRIADIDRVVTQIEQVFGAHARTLPGGIVLLG